MKLTVRLLQWKDLTPGRLVAWADLESRALDPNAYLSPHFVVPAQRYLSSHADPLSNSILVTTGAGRVMLRAVDIGKRLKRRLLTDKSAN